MIKNLKEKIFYLMAVGVSVFLLFFVVGCLWIGHEVKVVCQGAKKEYGGDCTEALGALLEDENRGFEARNTAIWALGQVGDARALPVLESYYTGMIPDREPLNAMISQYELRKAVNLAKGGTNLGAWVWRDKRTKEWLLEREEVKTMAEKLAECLPKSDRGSKETCERLLAEIESFEECVAAGFPAEESFPRRCRTADDRVFAEN